MNEHFMNERLRKIIDIAANELECEDRKWLGGATKNPVYKNESGGLVRVPNERFYKYIVLRGLIANFPFRADVEKDTHDVVVYCPKDNACKYKIVIEMKKWMSPSGYSEISSIEKDIEKLKLANSRYKLLMIFSTNPCGATEENKEYLSNQLDLNPNLWYCKKFFAKRLDGKCEGFWVAGYQI